MAKADDQILFRQEIDTQPPHSKDALHVYLCHRTPDCRHPGGDLRRRQCEPDCQRRFDLYLVAGNRTLCYNWSCGYGLSDNDNDLHRNRYDGCGLYQYQNSNGDCQPPSGCQHYSGYPCSALRWRKRFANRQWCIDVYLVAGDGAFRNNGSNGYGFAHHNYDIHSNGNFRGRM